MNVDQVKSLSDAAIELGNQSEVAAQKFRLGLTQAGQAGRVGGTVVVVDGGIGTPVRRRMRGKFLLPDTDASRTLPPQKVTTCLPHQHTALITPATPQHLPTRTTTKT